MLDLNNASSARFFTMEDAAVSGFIVVYGTLLVLGTIVCALFFVAMWRGRKVIGQWPFFNIVHSLMYLDSIYLIFQLAFVFPSMVPGDIANVTVDINETLNAADGLLYLTMLMTLNRLAVFVVPSMRFLFTQRNIHYTIAACWALTWFVCILCVLVRPMQKFNRSTLRFEDSGETIMSAPLLRTIIDYSDNAVPFVSLAIYVIIYWSIRQKRRVISNATLSFDAPRSREVDDRRMLLQAIVICIFLQLYNIVNIIATAVDDRGIADYILNMLMLILSVMNHSIHSAIFIVTNSTIRAFLPSVACFKSLCSNGKVRSRSSSHVKSSIK